MSEKQPKKKKTAGDVVLTVVLIAAICVFCYAGYNLFHIYTEYKKGTDEYNSITQMAVTERDPDGEAAGPEAGSELKAPMDIDFASLKSVNDDVVGWIYVEALDNVSYPIVKGKDNSTYLHMTYEKNYNFAGTIFVDYENSRDFGFVVSDNPKFSKDVFIPRKDSQGIKDGDKVVVEITSYGSKNRNPEGKIKENLGKGAFTPNFEKEFTAIFL